MGNCCSVEDDEVEDRARPDEILKDSMESHRSFLRHSFDNSHGRELQYSTASFCDALPGDQTQTTLIVLRQKTGRQSARTKFICDTNGMEYCSVREDDASRLTLVDAQGNDIAVLMGGREKSTITHALAKTEYIPTRDLITIYGFKPSFEGQQPTSAGLEGRELYEWAKHFTPAVWKINDRTYVDPAGEDPVVEFRLPKSELFAREAHRPHYYLVMGPAMNKYGWDKESSEYDAAAPLLLAKSAQIYASQMRQETLHGSCIPVEFFGRSMRVSKTSGHPSFPAGMSDRGCMTLHPGKPELITGRLDVGRKERKVEEELSKHSGTWREEKGFGLVRPPAGGDTFLWNDPKAGIVRLVVPDAGRVKVRRRRSEGGAFLRLRPSKPPSRATRARRGWEGRDGNRSLRKGRRLQIKTVRVT